MNKKLVKNKKAKPQKKLRIHARPINNEPFFLRNPLNFPPLAKRLNPLQAMLNPHQ